MNGKECIKMFNRNSRMNKMPMKKTCLIKITKYQIQCNSLKK